MARERTAKRREENEIEFGRLVAFSDGVFSIAITLLVLSLGIDKGLTSSEVTSELLDQWDNLLAFGLSFAVIGRFWVVHHRFFAEVDAFDGRLLGLNLLYLAPIAKRACAAPTSPASSCSRSHSRSWCRARPPTSNSFSSSILRGG